MSVLLLAFAPSAFATHPAPPPSQCNANVTSTYEMSDWNPNAHKARTIWMPHLACNGKTVLMSALPGATLTMNPAAGPTHFVNPGGTGTFTGDFQVIDGTNCSHPRVANGSTWHVTYTVDPPANNTGPKNTLNNENEYQLGIVTHGVMTSGNRTITFTNKPSNLSMGHQIGMGANDKEANDLGGAFWLYYELSKNGNHLKSGHGDFNFDLTCITTPSCPTDGGLGNDYNVYVCDDFTAWNSDAQGGVAVGGDADFYNYGVASLTDANGVGLTVGGNLDAYSAQVYNGIAEADTCLPDTDTDPSFNVLDPSGLSCGSAAGADCTNACAISDFIGAQADSNCTVTAQPWGAVDIHVSGSKAVCTLDTTALAGTFQSWVQNINSINVSKSVGSVDTLIVNVTGNQDLWGKNGQINLGGISQNAVVWNFGCNNDLCDDGHDPLEISGFSVKGSLVAPDCKVEFNNAHIDGQYIVGEHYGTGEFHDFNFTGDICP